MITGTDLLQISRARVNMDRTDLEAAGVIDYGEAGDLAAASVRRLDHQGACRHPEGGAADRRGAGVAGDDGEGEVSGVGDNLVLTAQTPPPSIRAVVRNNSVNVLCCSQLVGFTEKT